MPVPPFELNFEIKFLENYAKLTSDEQKSVDKAVMLLSNDPRYPSLNTHKAKNIKAKYEIGGNSVFIAYASLKLRLSFEYGPEVGMISLRNCGHHDKCERDL